MSQSRTAKFTTPAADEVRLDFVQDFGPHHEQTGKPGHAYYSAKQYRARQSQHGAATYPEPTPAPSL